MLAVALSFIILLSFLALSVPVASSIAGVSVVIGTFFSDYPIFSSIGELTWSTSTEYILLSIPFFVLLGELLLHSGMAKKIYYAINVWLSWLPGGLMHSNIAASTVFSSISGSSVATAATITTVAMPEGKKYGYEEGLFAGSIAAGGTLGILIPPSLNLIIYGFLTNTSIPGLFLAGLIPGIVLALLFMLYIYIHDKYKSSSQKEVRTYTWKEKFIELKNLIPILLLFILIMGTIYTGLATPTESAAIGLLGALAIIYSYKLLTKEVLIKSIEGTMKTTGMIMLIILAASFLNFVLISIGLIDEIEYFLEDLNISKYMLLFVITIMFIVLGLFIETLSLMVITIPIVAPIAIGMGFDGIWLGIYLIILIEMALITPPVGLNLYVVQSIRKNGSVVDVMRGCIPFVLIMCLMAFLLVIFPQISLYLVQFV